VEYWREIARGFGILMALEIVTRPDNRRDLEARERPASHGYFQQLTHSVLLSGSVLTRLRSGETSSSTSPWPELTMEIVLAGVGDSIDRQRGYLDRILEALLHDAGVATVIAWNEKGGRELAYQLPARWVPNPPDPDMPPHWQADRLLPVIALALVHGPFLEDWALCSRCGMPARKKEGGRGPRHGTKSYPWYGDHRACRALARAETMVQAEDRRAQKRRADRRDGQMDNDVDSQSDRQANGLPASSVD